MPLRHKEGYGPASCAHLCHRGGDGYGVQGRRAAARCPAGALAQIANLEDELGLRLFDRVGRRPGWTSEGERLLNDRRGWLNYARAVGEQAQVRRRGDVGVLLALASPHLIEGIFPDFLRHYAARYPNGRCGWWTWRRAAKRSRCSSAARFTSCRPSCARSPADEQRFVNGPPAPMQMLAACHPKLKLGTDGSVEIGRPWLHPLQATPTARCAGTLMRLPAGRLHAEQRPGIARAACAACHGGSRARRRHHPVGVAHPSLPRTCAPRHLSRQGTGGTARRPTSAVRRWKKARRCPATCSQSMSARVFHGEGLAPEFAPLTPN